MSAEVSIRRSRAIGCCKREQVDHLFLDLDLERVDVAVARDDRLRLVGVALEQRLDRQVQRRLGLARHGEQPRLDLRQLLVKMSLGIDAHPNLPVMYASVRSCLGLVKIWLVSPSSTSTPPRSKKPV